ncbi:Dabb family protein [Pedobacter sp. SYP-B3415]|uniref:Dabb family protein n=1 Tax=Pedobacter sp. SYP-B3415 TaxID=2496641 RepID=UPI00101BB188|nr:Dabb family protein [Pedobacter sp. SYP-B3415]
MKRRKFVQTAALAAGGAVLAPSDLIANMNNSKQQNLLHYVLFWLKDGLSTAEIESFKGFFEMLKKIETVKSLQYGRAANTPNRPVTDNSFSYSMTAIFDSVETHNQYQDDKRHHAAIEKYSHLWTKVVVHDTLLG